MIKKILIGLGVLCGLLLIIVITLPLVVDLNKYKTQIEKAVEQNINGTLRIGRISLRGIGVKIQNISLESKDSFKHKALLKVGEVRVKVGLLSLLTANPKATIVLNKPEISLVKNAEGQLNVTELPKKEQDTQTSAEKTKPLSEGAKLPAIILGAKLSFLAKDAKLQYIDEKTGSTTSVEDLNVSLTNVSFNSPIDFDISALLSSGGTQEALVQGKFSMSGRAKVMSDHSRKLKSVELDSKIALGELSAQVKGKISDFDLMQASLNISTPTLSLEKLKSSFGPLKKYNLEGTVSMNGAVKGPLKKLDQCIVNGKIDLQLKSRQTDLSFKTTVSNTLNNLKSEFVLESPLVNLDELMPSSSKKSYLMSEAYAEEKGPGAKHDVLASLKSNPIFSGLEASGHVGIKKVIYRKTEFTNIAGECDLKNMHFSISKFALHAFKGALNLKGDVRMGGATPTYDLSAVIQSFQTNPMLVMFSPAMKDIFIGTLSANMNISGAGATFEAAKKYLTGSGKVEVKDAELKGLNMGKALQEKLKLIAIFSGSDVLNEKLEGKINFIRSSLNIKNGRLNSPDAVLESPGYGATLKGYASFDKDINYQGDVLIPAKRLSRSLASLADSKGMVGFPFTLTGRLPKFDFNIDAGKVAQMALKATLKDSLGKKLKEKTGIDLPIDLPF